MKKVNLWIDTIKENHFEPRNAKFFDALCNNLAIHYGHYNIPSSWAGDIGLTHPDIARYRLAGKPNWEPNVILTDLGRNLPGANRIEYNKKCIRILWCADEHRHNDPTGRTNKGQAYIDYANGFDYVFLRQKSVINQYPKNKTFWFPHTVQDEFIPEVVEPKYDIVFIGRSETPERKEMVERLKDFNLFFHPGNLNEGDYIKTLSLGKITINRTQTDYEINKRVFEAMGSGSLLVTNASRGAGLENLFIHNHHLAIYSDFNHMVQLIQYYLKNEEERKRVARNGREEVLKKHTSSKRVEQIISFMENKL